MDTQTLQDEIVHALGEGLFLEELERYFSATEWTDAVEYIANAWGVEMEE